jgi:septum site-determining protein MinD
MIEKNGKIISIVSGKGGVGKSTTTVNLGAALAEEGNKVVVIDMDHGQRNLDALLGVELRVINDLFSLIEKTHSRAQTQVTIKQNKNLRLIAGSSCRTPHEIDLEKFKNVLEELKTSHDYILLDSPAGVDVGFEKTMFYADEVIVVVNPESSSITDSDRAIGLIDSKCNKVLENKDNPDFNGIKKSIIVNAYRPERSEDGEELTIEEIQGLLGEDIKGVVPFEEETRKLSNKGELLFYNKNNSANTAYTRIANRIIEGRILEEEEYNILSSRTTKVKKRVFSWFNKERG